MTLIQVRFDDQIAKQLRYLAVDKDTNVTELIRAAVAGFLLEEQGSHAAH